MSRAEELRDTACGVLKAYSGILFVDHVWIGVVYLAATFWFPNVGLAGLVAAAVGMTIGYLLRLPFSTTGVNVYSSLLVGLSLGAFYQLDARLVVLIVLSAALTVLLAAAMRNLLWRLGRLPVLSVPFVVVALTAALAANSFGGLTPYPAPSLLPPALFGNWFDAFFSSLGSVFFTPHPLVGIVLFAGIAVRSRYLAFLCLGGYASGYAVHVLLTVTPAPGLVEWTGFNFALTAMAIGGIFTVPSVATFALAMIAAGAAAVVTGALSNALLVYGLPVMASPFLLTTLTVLAALALRTSATGPVLLLDSPGLPETNFERSRLARARLGSLASVPLLPPFLGEWEIYQGFDGPHTHKDRWRFALDFHRTESGSSFRGTGESLEDYLAFGLPVLSPAYGTVDSLRHDLPDVAPGTVDTLNNWGNYVMIRTDGGWYVLLAHLQHDSIEVREGERVTPATVIGRCGNSGRSPQPHLHLQVQRHGGLGGGTVLFHLVSVISQRNSEPARFELVAELAEGDTVQRASDDPALVTALTLPVGRTLSYRCTDDRGEHTHRLHVDVTLLGQLRLVSERGASVAFEQRNGTLAFYDRQGGRDSLLDLVVLGLGVTPLSADAAEWRDAPPARLLPMSPLDRLVLHALSPLGAGIDSRYERVQVTEPRQQWLQRGRHVLELPHRRLEAETTVVIDPGFGCRSLELRSGPRVLAAELVAIGQRGDRGVRSWELAVEDADVLQAPPGTESA